MANFEYCTFYVLFLVYNVPDKTKRTIERCNNVLEDGTKAIVEIFFLLFKV